MIAVLRSIRLRPVMFAAAAAAVTELSAISLIATSAFLITRAAQQPSIAALAVAIAAVRGLAMARGAFRYLERLAGHDAALRAVAGLRSRVYRALTRRTGPRRHADLLTGLVSDSESIQDLLLRVALPTTTAISTSIAAIVVSAVLLPAAGPVLAAGLALAGLVVPALTAHRSGARLAGTRADLAAASLDLAEGARDLAAYGATRRARDRSRRLAGELAGIERAASTRTSTAGAAATLVQGLTVIAVGAVAIRSGADSVLVAVVVLTTLAAFEPVLPLADAAQQLTGLRPAAGRLGALITAPERAATTITTAANGDIDLHGVSVHYDRPALAATDLHIRAGTTIAIVGASGAGKSTLLNVLAGLLEPDHGLASLPSSRALTQDAHLFRTTARANLLMARPSALDADLVEAARQGGLADWIAALPDGWDTTVGERARRLSGGQRQRLLLTRVLLADPATLLLDEPTEALEPERADAVLNAILTARPACTTVVVTHRLAPLHAFDEILVMDGGRIVDRGPHQELLGRPGVYRDLWDAEQLTAAQLAVPEPAAG